LKFTHSVHPDYRAEASVYLKSDTTTFTIAPDPHYMVKFWHFNWCSLVCFIPSFWELCPKPHWGSGPGHCWETSVPQILWPGPSLYLQTTICRLGGGVCITSIGG